MNDKFKIIKNVFKYLLISVVTIILIFCILIVLLFIYLSIYHPQDIDCDYTDTSIINYVLNFRTLVGPSRFEDPFRLRGLHDDNHFVEYISCDPAGKYRFIGCDTTYDDEGLKQVYLNLYLNRERERFFFLIQDNPICSDSLAFSRYKTLITTEDGTAYTATEPPSITYTGKDEETFKVHLEQPDGTFQADYTFYIYWLDPEDFEVIKEERMKEIREM